LSAATGDDAWLLDTCVIVDYLRNRDEAVPFVYHATGRPSVSAVTVAELFAGARTTTEESRIDDLLHRLTIHGVDLAVARLGGAYRRRYGASHGVLIADALIAATARVHGARLVTRNARHFPMLDDVLVPYQ
jgi:predicted nucleic acid-binding protein